MSKRLALLELNTKKVGENVYAIACDLSFDELRHCANNLLDNGTKTCALLSLSDDGISYVVASKECDVSALVKALNEKFSGKGGGKPDYAQGKLAKAGEEELKATIEDMLIRV